tara:strand:- start:1142 stop:2662 length:1521 start_codon:yes stop_codon:yes gene_type:complete
MREAMSRQWRDIDIRNAAILISLVLSVWHILVNPVPNTDAFDYVRTAHVYLDQGATAAFQWYPSASYPVMMGMLSQLTGVDLILSGQLINAVLFAVLVYAFITLSLEMRNTPRVALIAAIVVLAFPSVNEYRYYLIRDIGFLALMLLGAIQLSRYSKYPTNWSGFGFIAWTLLAALFRAEALVYLPLAPLALLSLGENTWAYKLRALVKLEATLLALALIAFTALSIAGADVIGTLQAMLTIYLPFLTASVEALSAQNSPLGIAIFGEYAANFSGQYLWAFMFTGLSTILLIKLITGFGVPSLLLFLYGYKEDAITLRDPALRITIAYMIIAFAILLAFLALTRFIATRYTLMFCLATLPLLVLTIDKFIEPMQRSARRKLLQGVLTTLALFSVVDAHISFVDSGRSLDEAVQWLRDNGAQSEGVFTNSTYVAYFSGRVEDYNLINRYISAEDIGNTPFGTIVVLTTSRSIDAEIARSTQRQQLELLAAFPDQEDPEILIFRRIDD